MQVGGTTADHPPPPGANRTGWGLAVVAAGTAAAFGVSALWPAVSALTVAVVLGVIAGPLLPGATTAGLAWATRRCLRGGVVVLGLQLGLEEVAGLGTGTVVAVVVTVVIAFAGTLGLGRLLGVPRDLSLLVATGFSICGASAIAAMDSVARAEKRNVATAVALVTLYGSAAIALVPAVGGLLGLPGETVGRWAGLSVHEVAQVVAAASPAGAAAVGIAVVVKLTRVVLLAPVVAGVGLYERRRGGTVDGARRPRIVPLFVLGFLATMALRTTGVVPGAVLDAGKLLTTLLFGAALFALGCGVRAGELLRSGRRGLLLGAGSTVLVAAVALAALACLGAG